MLAKKLLLTASGILWLLVLLVFYPGLVFFKAVEECIIEPWARFQLEWQERIDIEVARRRSAETMQSLREAGAFDNRDNRDRK
jgi:hypothetical protein